MMRQGRRLIRAHPPIEVIDIVVVAGEFVIIPRLPLLLLTRRAKQLIRARLPIGEVIG